MEQNANLGIFNHSLINQTVLNTQNIFSNLNFMKENQYREILNKSKEFGVRISVADALTDLKNRGYKKEFRRNSTDLYCIELKEWIAPEQFNVDEYYHFEEISSPDIDRVIYAISVNAGIKGVLVDAYGVYADNISSEMVQKLSLDQNPSTLTSQHLNLNLYDYEKLRITRRRLG